MTKGLIGTQLWSFLLNPSLRGGALAMTLTEDVEYHLIFIKACTPYIELRLLNN